MIDPGGRPILSAAFFWIMGNLRDLRILKNADVEFGCLLSLPNQTIKKDLSSSYNSA
jgi:hypothetical protein